MSKTMNDAACAALYTKAYEAGMAAAKACVPTPMRVIERADPFNNGSPVVRDYGVVRGGVCGFAWVIVKPANSRFANWIKKNGHGRTSDYGGVRIHISAHGQSMEMKAAHAYAMSRVFEEAGINAYADSRMD